MEDQRADRQRLAPPPRYMLDAVERRLAEAADQPCEGHGLVAGDRVAVDGVQRIAILHDVQAGQVAPGAADRIEGVPLAGAPPIERRQRSEENTSELPSLMRI